MNNIHIQPGEIDKNETFSDCSSVKSERSINTIESETDVEEMSEIYLPKKDKLLPFFSLSDSDKCKVIELGLLFLQNGNKKTQFWDNKEWERKITEIEKQSDKEIGSLQEQIQKEKQNSVFLVEQFREQKQLLASEVRENVEIQYKQQLTDLKQQNQDLTKQMNIQNSEYRNLHMTLSEKYETKQRETEERFETRLERQREVTDRREQEMEAKIEKYKTQYENTLIRTQNSTIKGQDGEEFTYHQLNRLFPRAEITDCHKQPNRCDFIMQEDDFSMMLEIKNYKTNVNKCEIDKFYRDVDSEINNDIKCAILISLRSGICNKKDFDFEVRNGKPLLFLHNISDNMINITLAVKFLNMVLHQKDIDFTNQEIVDCFRNLASSIKRNFTRQRKQIEKYSAEQIALIAEQETNIHRLFNILKVKF